MSDAGHEPVAVQPPSRRRWLRRELWFAVAAILVVAVVSLAYRHHAPTHVAPGAPAGGIPAGPAAPVPLARPSPPPAQ